MLEKCLSPIFCPVKFQTISVKMCANTLLQNVVPLPSSSALLTHYVCKFNRRNALQSEKSLAYCDLVFYSVCVSYIFMAVWQQYKHWMCVPGMT